MANKKHNDTVITNEDTLVRRAWIESAVESVRARINTPLPQAESGSLVQDDDEDLNSAHKPAQAKPVRGERPHLYVAWSAGVRRSGT
jgi:hypothetical protein